VIEFLILWNYAAWGGGMNPANPWAELRDLLDDALGE
jgi:hypothetical protein